MKIKLLFLIADLGGGGAEKVLVNLVNNLNPDKYDITIRTIFSKGVNARFLNENINYIPFLSCAMFLGFTRIQKLFTPAQLYRMIIPQQKKYDIEIAYMQHVPTRILGGAPASSNTFAWVHTKHITTGIYRNLSEFEHTYKRFNGIAYVSEIAKDTFPKDHGFEPYGAVVHNVVNVDSIIQSALENPGELKDGVIRLCSTGRLSEEKGFTRLFNILVRLKTEGISNWHFYLIGTGELLPELQKIVATNQLADNITFCGFQTNPHKYVSKMDLFICSSYTEGYSTAVSESIILGTPVLTTDCSGMAEIFGGTDAGLIVPNDDESLYIGLKDFLLHPEKIEEMRKEAKKRSEAFSTANLVREFEEFIGTADA